MVVTIDKDAADQVRRPASKGVSEVPASQSG